MHKRRRSKKQSPSKDYPSPSNHQKTMLISQRDFSDEAVSKFRSENSSLFVTDRKLGVGKSPESRRRFGHSPDPLTNSHSLLADLQCRSPLKQLRGNSREDRLSQSHLKAGQKLNADLSIDLGNEDSSESSIKRRQQIAIKMTVSKVSPQTRTSLLRASVGSAQRELYERDTSELRYQHIQTLLDSQNASQETFDHCPQLATGIQLQSNLQQKVLATLGAHHNQDDQNDYSARKGDLENRAELQNATSDLAIKMKVSISKRGSQDMDDQPRLLLTDQNFGNSMFDQEHALPSPKVVLQKKQKLTQEFKVEDQPEATKPMISHPVFRALKPQQFAGRDISQRVVEQKSKKQSSGSINMSNTNIVEQFEANKTANRRNNIDMKQISLINGSLRKQLRNNGKLSNLFNSGIIAANTQPSKIFRESSQSKANVLESYLVTGVQLMDQDAVKLASTGSFPFQVHGGEFIQQIEELGNLVVEESPKTPRGLKTVLNCKDEDQNTARKSNEFIIVQVPIQSEMIDTEQSNSLDGSAIKIGRKSSLLVKQEVSVAKKTHAGNSSDRNLSKQSVPIERSGSKGEVYVNAVEEVKVLCKDGKQSGGVRINRQGILTDEQIQEFNQDLVQDLESKSDQLIMTNSTSHKPSGRGFNSTESTNRMPVIEDASHLQPEDDDIGTASIQQQAGINSGQSNQQNWQNKQNFGVYETIQQERVNFGGRKQSTQTVEGSFSSATRFMSREPLKQIGSGHTSQEVSSEHGSQFVRRMGGSKHQSHSIIQKSNRSQRGGANQRYKSRAGESATNFYDQFETSTPERAITNEASRNKVTQKSLIKNIEIKKRSVNDVSVSTMTEEKPESKEMHSKSTATKQSNKRQTLISSVKFPLDSPDFMIQRSEKLEQKNQRSCQDLQLNEIKRQTLRKEGFATTSAFLKNTMSKQANFSLIQPCPYLDDSVQSFKPAAMTPNTAAQFLMGKSVNSSFQSLEQHDLGLLDQSTQKMREESVTSTVPAEYRKRLLYKTQELSDSQTQFRSKTGHQQYESRHASKFKTFIKTQKLRNQKAAGNIEQHKRKDRENCSIPAITNQRSSAQQLSIPQVSSLKEKKKGKGQKDVIFHQTSAGFGIKSIRTYQDSHIVKGKGDKQHPYQNQTVTKFQNHINAAKTIKQGSQQLLDSDRSRNSLERQLLSLTAKGRLLHKKTKLLQTRSQLDNPSKSTAPAVISYRSKSQLSHTYQSIRSGAKNSRDLQNATMIDQSRVWDGCEVDENPSTGFQIKLNNNRFSPPMRDKHSSNTTLLMGSQMPSHRADFTPDGIGKSKDPQAFSDFVKMLKPAQLGQARRHQQTVDSNHSLSQISEQSVFIPTAKLNEQPYANVVDNCALHGVIECGSCVQATIAASMSNLFSHPLVMPPTKKEAHCLDERQLTSREREWSLDRVSPSNLIKQQQLANESKSLPKKKQSAQTLLKKQALLQLISNNKRVIQHKKANYEPENHSNQTRDSSLQPWQMLLKDMLIHHSDVESPTLSHDAEKKPSKPGKLHKLNQKSFKQSASKSPEHQPKAIEKALHSTSTKQFNTFEQRKQSAEVLQAAPYLVSNPLHALDAPVSIKREPSDHYSNNSSIFDIKRRSESLNIPLNSINNFKEPVKLMQGTDKQALNLVSKIAARVVVTGQNTNAVNNEHARVGSETLIQGGETPSQRKVDGQPANDNVSSAIFKPADSIDTHTLEKDNIQFNKILQGEYTQTGQNDRSNLALKQQRSKQFNIKDVKSNFQHAMSSTSLQLKKNQSHWARQKARVQAQIFVNAITNVKETFIVPQKRAYTGEIENPNK